MPIELRTADGRTYTLKTYGGGEGEEQGAWNWLSESSIHNPDAYLEAFDEDGVEWTILERTIVAKRQLPG